MLDFFIAMQEIWLVFIKWSSLQKSVSKFIQKYFYEIDPGVLSYNGIFWEKTD